MAKTIVGELIDLYVKFGGNKSDLTGTETTAEMIDAIEQIYEDKGDTLPEVTSDDNGKMLGVVNGEWDKADVPTELPEVTAEDDGKMLGVVNGEWDKADVPTELPAVTSDDNGKMLGVVNGEWNKEDVPTELPAVTSDDNGKVLGVVDGEWGKTMALPYVSAPFDNNKVLSVVNGAWAKGSPKFTVMYRLTNGTLTTNNTYNEIYSVEDNKFVRAYLSIDNDTNIYLWLTASSRDGTYTFTTVWTGTNGAPTFYRITHKSDNTLTYYTKTLSVV